MDRLRLARGSQRSCVTRIVTGMEAELAKDEPDQDQLQAFITRLEKAMSDVLISDQKIMDAMLDADASPDELDQESITVDEYKNKAELIIVKVNRILQPDEIPVNQEGSVYGSAHEVADNSRTRKYRLPKIELKKFDGNIRGWLAFWSQFSKIDEDNDLATVDKFQYLRQSTVDGSKAREVVDSFPMTPENYPKAIAHLKARFGNEDLLVEVYVRELLRLVLQNNTKDKLKFSVSSLYDCLETQLRALESLGVTSDKFAAILYPLVESSLPEDILVAWERNRTQMVNTPKIDADGNPIILNRLTLVMGFLRSEVESAERISLAKSGFGLSSSKEGKLGEKVKKKYDEVPTAAGLFSGHPKSGRKLNCLFCDKNHSSNECYTARNMSHDEKKDFVYNKRACYYCLNLGHMAKNCRVKVKCTLCTQRHYAVMCPDLVSTKKTVPVSLASSSESPVVKPDNSLTNRSCKADVLLQTLMVKVRNNEKTVVVRALFDSGSERSYITEKVAQMMNYECVGEETTVHALFGGSNSLPHKHKKYDVRLTDLKEQYFCTFKVLDQPTICGDIPKIKKSPWMGQLRKYGIWLTDFGDNSTEIDVLIGADVGGKLETGRRIELPCGIVAKETLLGWTAMGRVPNVSMSDVDNSRTMTVRNLLSREACISDLWRLDMLGITDSAECKSKEELQQAAMEHFQSTVKIEDDGRYVVGLPWIEGHPPLLENRPAAEARLNSTTKKLIQTGDYDRYEQVFEEWLQEGIIEEVPKNELTNAAHYLPHRAVLKENSATTKVRPVFDASAKEKGSPSLNDCLEKGPNLLELMPALINRFRLKKFGVISDICKAFLQIKVKENECDFLRFLWWQKDRKTQKVFRHKRVVFGVSSSPFLLGAVLKHILDRAPPELKETAEYLRNSLYVDNCVSSVDSEESLGKFIVESQELFMKFKFDLRGWEHSVISPKDLSPTEEKIVPVLGMLWNKEEDNLSCDLKSFDFESIGVVTKRKILSVAHKIFDVIGFTAPILLSPKLILQETWSSKLGWDEELPTDLAKCFVSWMKQLPLLSEVKIPRWILGENCNADKITLHMFCDASVKAYAACVFVRVETCSGVKIQLVQAKARVAPVETDKKCKVSISRKELLSCFIGARLLDSVKRDLGFQDVQTFLWTDSMNAYYWITCDDQWGTFVWNRVKEIRKLSNVEQWNHVPGVLNPADLPSRGCNVKKLLESKWWLGPEWLYKSPEEWPNSEIVPDDEIVNSERKKAIVSCVAREQKEKGSTGWLTTATLSFDKMLRIVCRLRRFIFNCKNVKEDRKFGIFSVKEIEDAEKNIIRLVQHEAFAVKDPVLWKMQVFVDKDGVLRVKSKIAMLKDKEEFRCPAILPSQHPVVESMIRKKHLEMCHAGVQTLMSVVREKFWILRSRRTIRKVISSCVKCRRFQGKSVVPAPTVLPEDRVKAAHVFEVTGIDLAGPMFLKGGSKAWIVLFTCAVYRAVHLEVVTSLSTEAFLLAFRRFIARRGRPNIVYSDNGTNFVGAENYFKKLDWGKIDVVATAQRIEWKYIPPSAAWWGGWWERLIGLLKSLLRKVMGKASLQYEEVATILCDCEEVMNSRPLTYMSENPEELLPLTPKMFIQDVQECGVPDMDAVDAANLNKRCQYRQKLRKDFRERFRLEYLGQLANRQNKMKTGDLAVGDIILVGNDNLKRIDWPLGRIVELIKGKDMNARVARVKTAVGEILRPVQRLFPMEVSGGQRKVLEKFMEVASAEGSKGYAIAPSHPKENAPIVPAMEEITTRCGRKVHPPERFGV